MMRSVANLVAVLLPSCAAAFEAADSGIVHDVAVPHALVVGMATLSSSATIMVGNMSTGDAVTFGAPLLARVEPDGSVAWTRIGEGAPQLMTRVTNGPDDTVLVLAGSELFRYDADGNELWGVPLGANVVDVLSNATGITALMGVANDGRLIRLASDGSVLWQTSLSDAVGCGSQCPPYLPTAMAVDPDGGIVVLSDYPSTPPQTRVFGLSTGGALLWQTLLDPVDGAAFARSADGRFAVFGADAVNGGLLLQVRESDGSSAWTDAIEAANPAVAKGVSFDDAGNVYTLGGDSTAWATDAFTSAGTSRWSYALPQPFAIGVEVGSATQPVIVVNESPQGDLNYGIAQDGTEAFDTTLDQMAGTPYAWHRFADGGLVTLDMTRDSLQTLILGHLGVDGGDVWYATPGPTELPTQTSADSIAWQDSGEKTVVAVAGEQYQVIVRFDERGDVLWRSDLPEGGTIARGIGTDTLTAMSTSGSSGTTLDRRDATGAIVWEITDSGDLSSFAASDDGNSFVVLHDGLDSWNLERHDASGALVWSTALGVVPSMSKQGTINDPDLITAPDGSVYAYGQYGVDGQIFVRHFSAAGVPLWFQSFGGLVIGGHERGLAEDENGIVYLAYDVTASPGPGVDTYVYRLAANGQVAWFDQFPQERMAQTPRSLIAANDGGVLLATSAAIHRVDAAGDVVWTYPEECASGCVPTAIRQRQDGHVFALSTVGAVWPQLRPTEIRVSELYEGGALVDQYVSTPRPQSQDTGVDLRIDGTHVDVAGLSMSPDGLSRVRFQRLDEDLIFANGFEPES